MLLWTLAATLVASFTALLIAFVAYPWQKRKDRELQIQLEKRAAYREYAWALKKLHLCVFAEESDELIIEAIHNSRKSFNDLIFFAPIHIIRTARAITDRIQELQHEIRLMREGDPQHSGRWDGVERVANEIQRLEVELLAATRSDILECDMEEAIEAAKLVFQKKDDL